MLLDFGDLTRTGISNTARRLRFNSCSSLIRHLLLGLQVPERGQPQLPQGPLPHGPDRLQRSRLPPPRQDVFLEREAHGHRGGSQGEDSGRGDGLRRLVRGVHQGEGVEVHLGGGRQGDGEDRHCGGDSGEDGALCFVLFREAEQ